jgi:hypothetical protein
MYSVILLLHSWVRWAVLLLGLLAFVRALTRARRPWTPLDDQAGRWFTASLDLQFLLGALLYVVLSPFTTAAFKDFGAAMANPGLRFWAVEHAFGMVVGLALAHVGRARIRRATSDARRHRLAAIFYGLALVSIVVSIPWPGRPNGRPLVRW